MKLRKALVVLAIGTLLGGCGTIPFKIGGYSENRSETQRQLDNLECSNLSRVEGPCL